MCQLARATHDLHILMIGALFRWIFKTVIIAAAFKLIGRFFPGLGRFLAGGRRR